MFGQVQQKLSALNTVLQENLAGIKVIKAFTREKQQQAKFKAPLMTRWNKLSQLRACSHSCSRWCS